MSAKKGVRPTSGPSRRSFLKGALAAGAVAASPIVVARTASAASRVVARRGRALLRPHGVAVSRSGRIYVADSGNYRIAVLSGDDLRIVRTLGNAGFGPGKFNYPVGIDAVPFLGRDLVLVADSNNGRICLYFVGDGSVKETDPIGSLGGSPGLFYTPQGVRLGPHGEIVVANTRGHNVQVWTIDPEPRVKAVWGIMGDDGGRVTPGDLAYTFRLPTDLNFKDPRNVLVLDSKHGRIVRLTPGGGWDGSFGTTGDGEGEMNLPQAMTRADDSIYVADTGNGRIVKWSAAGAYEGAYAEGFRAPTGIAFDERNERLIVADRELPAVAAIPVF